MTVYGGVPLARKMATTVYGGVQLAWKMAITVHGGVQLNLRTTRGPK